MTPEQLDALKQAIRAGNDVDTAAHFAGVSVANVYRWLEAGKLEAERIAYGEAPNPDLADYLTFWEELRKSRAEAIVRNVAHIQKAAQNGAWQAAAWWLERTVPETYARSKGAKNEVEGQQPKQVTGA